METLKKLKLRVKSSKHGSKALRQMQWQKLRKGGTVMAGLMVMGSARHLLTEMGPLIVADGGLSVISGRFKGEDN